MAIKMTIENQPKIEVNKLVMVVVYYKYTNFTNINNYSSGLYRVIDKFILWSPFCSFDLSTLSTSYSPGAGVWKCFFACGLLPNVDSRKTALP